jgi:hypothetical protein
MQLGALLGNLPQDYLQGLQQQQQIKQFQLINQILGQQAGGAAPAQPAGDIYGAASGPGAGPAADAGPSTDVASLLKGAIYGQESGSGRNTSTSAAGARGGMQIMPATFAANAQPGEDINNAADNKAVGDRILDKYLAKYSGDWRRAAVAYYNGEGNVAPPGSPTPWIKDIGPKPGIPGPTSSGYVQQVGARMARNRAQGAQVASTDPNFVPQQGGQPQAVQTAGGAAPTPEAAPPQQIAQNAPAPAPVAPGGVSAASALVPAQWRSDPKGYADWLGNRANQLRAQADKVESGAKIQAGPIKIEPKAEGLRKAADDADATRTRVLDAIKQEAEPTGPMKEARQAGYASPQEAALGEEAGKADLKRGGDLLNSINATANEYGQSLRNDLRLARSVLSTPGTYTGFGADQALTLNRAKDMMFGTGAAAPQELLEKTRASTVLATMQNMKDEMLAAGTTGGKIYSNMAEQMEKSVPGLETSLTGNRALVEIRSRLGEFQLKLQKTAQDYLDEQAAKGVKYPYLDRGFTKKLADVIEKENPFTDAELRNPRLLGSPSAPPGMTRQQFQQWGHGMGLKPNDPYREPSGRLVPFRIAVPMQ